MAMTDYTISQANLAVTQANSAVKQANIAVAQANNACTTAVDCSEIAANARKTADKAIEIANDKEYSKLTNAPTNVSYFFNDAGYITAVDCIATDEEVGEMLTEIFD